MEKHTWNNNIINGIQGAPVWGINCDDELQQNNQKKKPNKQTKTKQNKTEQYKLNSKTLDHATGFNNREQSTAYLFIFFWGGGGGWGLNTCSQNVHMFSCFDSVVVDPPHPISESDPNPPAPPPPKVTVVKQLFFWKVARVDTWSGSQGCSL